MHSSLAGSPGMKPSGPLVKGIEPLAGSLTARPGMRRFFRGDAVDIPLHGILSDGPFDAWRLAIFLGFFKDDGTRDAAKRLGAVVAEGSRHQARVVFHAAIKGAATFVYLASWAALERRRHGLGMGLARAGARLLLTSGGNVPPALERRRRTPYDDGEPACAAVAIWTLEHVPGRRHHPLTGCPGC